MAQQELEQPWHERRPASSTITRAGALLVAATALLLGNAARLTLPILETFVVPLSGWGVLLLGRLLQLAAFLLLARGMRDQPGAASGGRIGRLCLVVWGAGGPVLMLVEASPLTVGDFPALPYMFTLAQILVSLAAVVAAVAIARAGVLHGWTAWVLLPAAVVGAAGTAAQLVPALFEAVHPVLERVFLLQLVLLLLAGAVLLITDHGTALRARARAIRDAW